MMTSEEAMELICSMGSRELEAYGLVKGPVDADGVMWHSGDMSDTNWGVIDGIAYSGSKWYVRGHDLSAPWMEADSIRHYREQTVEELLGEMYATLVTRAFNDSEVRSCDEIISEYADKIRRLVP